MVIDASVVVDALLVGTPEVVAYLSASGELHAGQHLAAEVTSALRAGERRGRVHVSDALALAVADLAIRLHPIRPLLPRVWQLRHNLTPYDAWYVALAEALDVPLLTLDRRIAEAPGVGCEVRVPGV